MYLRVRRPARNGRLISVDDPSAAILQTLVDCCKQKKLERDSERTKRKRDKVIIDQVTHEEEHQSERSGINKRAVVPTNPPAHSFNLKSFPASLSLTRRRRSIVRLE